MLDPVQPRGEFRRARGAQVCVRLEAEILQPTESQEALRDRTLEIVVHEPEQRQAGERSEFNRDRTREVVSVQSQVVQAGEAPSSGGIGPDRSLDC